MAIEFLLARGEYEIPLVSLRAMAAGGIHDQIGGGFARYSVDATWTVPHFEKMLYDNALLARAYLHGWQVAREERLATVCRQTLDWALREMRGPEGGFYSALDADSEGVEGKFYVWRIEELHEVLGDLAPSAIAYFGATESGNFEEGTNVLQAHGPVPERLEEIRSTLLAAREHRVSPRARRQTARELERADDLRPRRRGRGTRIRSVSGGRAGVRGLCALGDA